ncbi:helix-turn-helix domain-containing protein [Bradyrhizobium sp. C9]|uniref:helix-turn-helix domain-containing protein n=1 Tax=Bradyrhizobium sp. C9 TaxID=142585 RepID=UPI001177625E|nr:helix-turn-helix domain-containing protein [Bradyrhizobium sp. C9]
MGVLDSGRLHVPFIQQDIADACGPSTVHVNRTIQELRRRTFIEWNGHAVDLFQRDQFEIPPLILPALNFFGRRLVLCVPSKSTSARQLRSIPPLFDLQSRSLGCFLELLEHGYNVRDLPEVTVAKLRRRSGLCGESKNRAGEISKRSRALLRLAD